MTSRRNNLKCGTDVHCFNILNKDYIFYRNTNTVVRLIDRFACEAREVECIGIGAPKCEEIYNHFGNPMRKPVVEFNVPLNMETKSISVFLSDDCNLMCDYCYEGDWPSAGAMDINLAKKVAAYILLKEKVVKGIQVSFFGGEPTTNLDALYTIVDGLKGSTCKLSITTNGTLISNNLARYLVNNHISVVVSIDGPKAIHDKYRRTREGLSTFSDVIRNAIRLNRLQVKSGKGGMTIRSTIDLEDYAQRSEIYEYLRAMIPGAKIMISNISTKDVSADYIERYDKLLLRIYTKFMRNHSQVGAISTCEAESESMENIGRVFNRLERRPKTRKIRNCNFGQSTISIGPKGRLYPCHRICRGEDRYCLGSIEDGIDQGKLRRIHDTIRRRVNEKCLQCWAASLCRGICSISVLDDRFVREEYWKCELIRREIEYVLWLYDNVKGKKERVQSISDAVDA